MLLFDVLDKRLNCRTWNTEIVTKQSLWFICFCFCLFWGFFLSWNGWKHLSRHLSKWKFQEISRNAETGNYRFWLCFGIPSLRQLVRCKGVRLLAKWDHDMNITIWPAWSCALLTHMHARRNDKVSSTVHLTPIWAGTTAWTRHSCKLTADPHGPSQN